MTQTLPEVRTDLPNLKVGDFVEVLSAEEILATLDERGEFENLPFMPEMLAYCGRRMVVEKVAHKLCDTISRSGMRRMTKSVHLADSRCDGSAHGGCQTACTLFWKEAWLRPVDARNPSPTDRPSQQSRISLPLLEVNSRKEAGPGGETRYSCQATELLRAAPVCLPLLKMDQYFADVKTGNATPARVVRAFGVGLFNRVQERSRRSLPPALLFRGGRRWRFLEGKVVGRTPTSNLGLQPGDRVRIKSKAEILATLDGNLLNRGMGFDEEMSRFCGQTAIVKSRVERCIDEKSGRMLTMKSPCIILEGNVCAGAYSANCPRAFIPFWREIWLERVTD